MKTLSLILATCSIGLCNGVQDSAPTFQISKAMQDAPATQTQAQKKSKEEIIDLKAGNFLASRFAQANHDWKNASLFIDPILSSEISHDEILQRAMIIAMGAGEHKRAIKLAQQAKTLHPDESNTIADTFLIVDAFKKKDYKKAETLFKILDDDATVAFIGPFIKAWISAANGKANVKDLKQNTIQLYHAILISDFLNDHTDVEHMIDKAMKVEDISTAELERIADLYGHVGMKDKALSLYNRILEKQPDDEAIKDKVASLNKGLEDPLFKKVKTVQQGMAQAFYDIARILYNEKNDESARVFAHLALYLAPDLSQTAFLLGDINTRHKQYEQAITLYKSVPKTDDDYLQAQYDIVDIYDETEQFDKALSLLNTLSKKEQGPDTLIKIGDLYRHRDQFSKALELYNRAAAELGNTIPQKYWHLHYVRGIAYEQVGQWDNAEKELTAALKLEPDHPYVLNYLGYSWVDRGVKLDEATAMIQKAVDARPNDGYITDSLGWAMYRNTDYKNAVKTLERAVELLPYDPTVNDHLGDAYWHVGRKLEARFQWERAKNNSEDEEQIKKIEAKISSGLKNEI